MSDLPLYLELPAYDPRLPIDDAQCVCCGRRYDQTRADDMSLRWFVHGAEETTYLYCGSCTVQRRPLPVPFPCLFENESYMRFWQAKTFQYEADSHYRPDR